MNYKILNLVTGDYLTYYPGYYSKKGHAVFPSKKDAELAIKYRAVYPSLDSLELFEEPFINSVILDPNNCKASMVPKHFLEIIETAAEPNDFCNYKTKRDFNV